ncbi:ROK family transcriptional regulator [Paracoccaceae bacterium Fryx2]|nr:ROK family transcriptional regulator [Paracoccaceae bacterium Fryx2]
MARQTRETASDRAASEAGARRGSNQSGMRAHNERLVLSLVRQHGALAKSDIARITGLSAQTVSVIMRSLEQDGLLLRGEPIRGRIGQPSVPMSLAAEGAYFFGLKIGRRSTDLILIDFLGHVVGMRRRTYPWPTPGVVVAFVQEALPTLSLELPFRLRGRIGGMGIAMPFQLWNWAQFVGAPPAGMDDWRGRDIQAEIAAFCDMPVYLQNDATAACGGELVFGTGERPADFLYFFIAHFVGGGLVLNGQLYTGRTGNAAAIGSMPVPAPGGGMQQLISVASLASLERYVAGAGGETGQLWEPPTRWTLPPGVLDRWIAEAAQGVAHAILSAATVIDFGTVMIDGWLPEGVRAALVAATAEALARLDLAGIEPPLVRAGTVGHVARSLGAASIPLSQRYLIDQNAFRKDG